MRKKHLGPHQLYVVPKTQFFRRAIGSYPQYRTLIFDSHVIIPLFHYLGRKLSWLRRLYLEQLMKVTRVDLSLSSLWVNISSSSRERERRLDVSTTSRSSRLASSLLTGFLLARPPL